MDGVAGIAGIFCLSRNYRFACSAYRPTGLPRQGFGPVLAHGARQPRRDGRFSVSRPRNPRNAVCLIDSADTSPSPHLVIKNLLRSAGRLSGWHRQRHNPLQHIAKQPPRQVALRQQQPIVAGCLIRRPPVFTGASTLVVVANGIASQSVSVNVGPSPTPSPIPIRHIRDPALYKVRMSRNAHHDSCVTVRGASYAPNAEADKSAAEKALAAAHKIWAKRLPKDQEKLWDWLANKSTDDLLSLLA